MSSVCLGIWQSHVLSAFRYSALRADSIYHLTCDQKTLVLRKLENFSCIFCLFKKHFIIENSVHKSTIYNGPSCIDYDYPPTTSLSTWPVLPHPYCHTPVYCSSLHHTIFESNQIKKYHFICFSLYILKDF